MTRIRLEAGSEPLPGLRLTELRGRGGFAEVWDARGQDGQVVAVKFMRSENRDSSAREMKIIRAIQNLNHPNLLRIHSVWAIPGYIVVTMESADGSLLELLDAHTEACRCPLSAHLVISYLRQAAEALDFLNAPCHHFDGRVVAFQHCDVKPSNLLVFGSLIKLADFGLCTPMGTFQSSYRRAGTLEFAAPEVHRGYLTHTSDQYSLGVTYYYLRTGRLPFSAPGQFDRRFSYSRPTPDLGLVTAEEQSVLRRALEIEPTQRWPSCVHFIDAMEVRVRSSESKHGSSPGLSAHGLTPVAS